MSISTPACIFLRTGLPPGQCAARLAEVLHARLTREPGAVHLHRAIGPVDRAGGEVGRNLFGAPPEEFAVLDGYDTTFEIHSTIDEARAEATRMFDEITLLPWPALLVFDLETLVSAYHPAHGQTAFPPGTTVGDADQPRLRPYVVDAPVQGRGLLDRVAGDGADGLFEEDDEPPPVARPPEAG